MIQHYSMFSPFHFHNFKHMNFKLITLNVTLQNVQWPAILC